MFVVNHLGCLDGFKCTLISIALKIEDMINVLFAHTYSTSFDWGQLQNKNQVQNRLWNNQKSIHVKFPVKVEEYNFFFKKTWWWSEGINGWDSAIDISLIKFSVLVIARSRMLHSTWVKLITNQVRFISYIKHSSVENACHRPVCLQTLTELVTRYYWAQQCFASKVRQCRLLLLNRTCFFSYCNCNNNGRLPNLSPCSRRDWHLHNS